MALLNGIDDSWANVGSSMTDFVRAHDWQPTAVPSVFYDADNNAYCTSFILGAHESQSVCLEDDVDFCLIETDLAQILALQEVAEKMMG